MYTVVSFKKNQPCRPKIFSNASFVDGSIEVRAAQLLGVDLCRNLSLIKSMNKQDIFQDLIQAIAPSVHYVPFCPHYSY